MTTLQKWLLGVLAALGIGTVAVVTKPSKPSTPTPPPVVVDTTHPDTTVTPPPVTPVTPSGHYTPIASDSFVEYATTAALQAKITKNIGGTCQSACLYNDGANASLVAIDNTVLYHGHRTMKYSQPGGTSLTPQLWVDFTPTVQHLWFRVKIRFSPGFTTTGTLTNSANAYKLLGFAFSNYDGSGRLEITNTNQYQLYWDAVVKNSSTMASGETYGVAGNITTEWTDGGWYDYIIEVDFTTNPNGTARVWMAKDGQTPVLKATSIAAMLKGYALPALNSAMLSLNFNQTRTAAQTQAVWYGEWSAIDGAKYPNPYGVSGG